MGLSAELVKKRLDDAGYDTDQIEGLGRTLGLDLFNFLAVWTPLVAEPRRRRWWQWWRQR